MHQRNLYNSFMTKLLRKIDDFLDRHTSLWIFLLIMVILRVPNFFEPYWYGDEAIYLTVGQSIRAGKNLYTQIVDHKTPLIYYFASVPSQFWFRFLLLSWMSAATAAFYVLSRKLFKQKYLVWFSLAAFVLLTTLPWFEGHIPNGELFVMGFVLMGMWFLSNSSYLQPVLNAGKKAKKKASKIPLSLLGGFFFGLGILTKVPALLDLAGILVVAWFVFAQNVLKKPKNWLEHAIDMLKQITPIVIGAALPILLSIIYFVLRGAGQDYLRFGLLYNLHYTQSWQLDLGSRIANFLFSMPGKTIILFSFIALVSLIKNLSLKFKFLSAWFLLTLYSVLLSNRPYPHYFLQAVPPLVWMVTTMIENILNFSRQKKKKIKTLIPSMIGGVLIGCSLASLLVLNFGTYSVKSYYQSFYKFATGKINQQEYYRSFNGLMRDNYELANYLQQQQVDNLFIWGDNPMLYAVSGTIPTSRFTVAFHITDLEAYAETLEEIKQKRPKYIVVMDNAPVNFLQLYQYLDQFYLPNSSYEHMTLYKRQ